jgi:hypothetical protein
MATQNMKPAPDEAIDALWGQNVGDWFGAMRTRPNYFLAGVGTEGTVASGSTNSSFNATLQRRHVFQRWAGHNTLVGTYTGTWTFTSGDNPDCIGTHGPAIYGDLGTFSAVTTFATANIGASYTGGSTYAFSVDLSSYVSVGSWATMVCLFIGTSDNANVQRTLTSELSIPAKIHTTWS